MLSVATTRLYKTLKVSRVLLVVPQEYIIALLSLLALRIFSSIFVHYYIEYSLPITK
jgi:hypothetical protein